MKQNRLHRGMALLLAVCMMLTMNGGFAFAAEEDAPAEASVTETTESTSSPETSGEVTAADDEQEELSDPMGSDSEGETPSLNAPVCTCNPAPGTSSVEGHGEDCPLYEELEPPADEQGECICPPVDSGEVVHGEDCPLYEKPAVPEIKCVCTVLCTVDTVNADCPVCTEGFEKCAYTAPAPTEALGAVYALIDTLPTMTELEAVDTEGADFPAYLEKLQADAAAARAAYDALTPEEREAFDPARLEKLAGIEGLFGVATMAITQVKPQAGSGTQDDPWQVTTAEELAYAMKPPAGPSYAKLMNPFTVSETIELGKKAIYLDGNGQEITYDGKPTASSYGQDFYSAGLFNKGGSATFEIKNLGLNAQISGYYEVGRSLTVGGLFEDMSSAVKLTNCYVRGEISPTATLTGTADDISGIKIAGITPSHKDAQLDLKNVAVDVVPTPVNWYIDKAASLADKDRAGTASFAVSSYHYGTGGTSFDNCWFKGGNALYSEDVTVNFRMAVGTPIETASGADFYSDLQACVDGMNAGIAADKDESFNTWEIKDGHLAFGPKWKAELKMDTGTASISNRVASFPSFSISSPGGSDLKSVSVQLTGRQVGDALALAAGTGFTTTKNDDGSRLTLTASGQTDAAWTAELKKLQITLGAEDAERSLRFEADASSSAISSDAVYNRENGHYYKTISADSYGLGKTAAESAVLNLGTDANQKWKGYLATVTTQEEQDFVRGAFGTAFIGASSDKDMINATGKVTPRFTYNGDSWTNDFAKSTHSQGKYYWVSGPEAGTPIWQQTAPKPRFTDQQMAGQAVGGSYTAFAEGKPNNYRAVNNNKPGQAPVPLEIHEDERHLATSPDGWDDQSDKVLKIYLVEFGGRDAGETGATAESFKAVNATITPSGMTADTTPDPGPEKPAVPPEKAPDPAPAPDVDNTNHLTSLYATAGGKTYSVTPTFDHALHAYTLVVPVGTASVVPGATYTGAGTIAGLGSAVTLTDKKASFTVTFTAGGKDYPYTVAVLANAEAGSAAGEPPADLTNLAVSEVVGGYTFVPATYSYPSIVVKKAATSVAVTPTFSGSTVNVNGTTTSSGTAVNVPLNTTGATTVLVNVTGSGALSKAYHLTITKNTAVAITAKPTHATTYLGTDGSIAITASGGQGIYEYSKDNTNWQDAATLTGLAAGDYTVYARDKADTANVSAGTRVTVKQPAAKPVVTLAGDNTVTNMTYGDLLKLGVTATAPDGGALTYQWYKGGSSSSTKIEGATAATYVQPESVARLAAGTHTYYCYVTNTKVDALAPTSVAGPTITVTVNKYTPTVTLVANPTTTTHGETVKLTATVNAASGGGTPTGTVTFKDGETVLGTVNVTRNAISGHGEAVYNYAIPISHGEITATYTAADSGNYNSVAPVSVAVTVNKKPLTITVAPPASLTYDGTPKTATLTGADGLTEGTDYTLTYSPADPTDVGSYTATFALTTAGDAKYTASGTLSVNFAITQAAGSGTVSCADIMFGDTVAPVPVSATNGITNVTYLYKVKNAEDSTYSATVPAVVGDYTVKATFAATTNYTEATATADFKITPAAIAGITVTPYTGVYDGEEHPIVTVTGTQTGDKVYYTIPSGSPTETVPMVTKVADNMTVLVKVTRANHTDYAPTDRFSAKVGEKEVAATFTVPTDLVYDGNDKTVTAAITNKCGADDVSLTLGNATGKAVGEYTTTVTGLSGAAAGNYKLPSPAPEQKWEIIGTPYPDPITLPTASGITYGQKLADSVLTGDNIGTGVFTWNDGAILPPSGSYTATVVFDPTDPNFDSVTREVQVAVAKADVMLEVSGTKAYHTTPIANADFVVSNITGMVNGETDVSLLGTLTLTSDGNKQAAIVGSYDISVAQSGESNYSVTTTSVANGFTVTRAAQTLSGGASYQKLLTEADFPLDVKTDSTDTDAAVTYTLTNDGGGAVTLDADGKTVRIKKPGTATITANGLQTANFAAAAPLTITVTIGNNPAVRALATEGITTTEAKIGGVVTTGTIATTGYGLEYKKATDADYTPVSASETATGDAKTLTHTLAGLEKDTEYAVRIWAKTADKTFESVTRFRTAAEQPPTGKVEGAITDNSGENTAITVTIEAGNTVIASHTVKAGSGKFTFEALPDGFYNLVADNGKYKVTRMVEIVKGGAVTNVQMEIGKTQSVVEIVTPDTPNVAVDGLPELFGNDILFTQDNEAVITAGGTVEFKLTVEKKDTPADAEEIDKIAEGKVGAYLDIGLLKTVIDQNGREQESELVPDLGANEITIVIPLPKELQGKQSYTVYRVHNGTAEKLDSTHNADGNTLTIQSSLFSTYAIAYTEKSGGTGGGSGGNSHDEDNYNFWQKVKDKIHSSDNGDTVKAGAGSYDKMPESVMDALRKNPGVTLEITWNGGDKITIPAGGALEKDGLRIYYPLAYLAEQYAKASIPAPEKNHINPKTGGVWEVNAPVTAVQTPAITTPKNEGTADTPEQAQVERAAIEPSNVTKSTNAPAIAEDTPSPNKVKPFTGITIMLAAAAVACGVIIWKKKNEEEQINEK